jgi:hypothetical protein
MAHFTRSWPSFHSTRYYDIIHWNCDFEYIIIMMMMMMIKIVTNKWNAGGVALFPKCKISAHRIRPMYKILLQMKITVFWNVMPSGLVKLWTTWPVHRGRKLKFHTYKASEKFWCKILTAVNNKRILAAVHDFSKALATPGGSEGPWKFLKLST